MFDPKRKSIDRCILDVVGAPRSESGGRSPKGGGMYLKLIHPSDHLPQGLLIVPADRVRRQGLVAFDVWDHCIGRREVGNAVVLANSPSKTGEIAQGYVYAGRASG